MTMMISLLHSLSKVEVMVLKMIFFGLMTAVAASSRGDGIFQLIDDGRSNDMWEKYFPA
jgi:hypothetical protein